MPHVNETYDDRFWQDGIAGPNNIVCYNGEDVRGVAFVADDEQRHRIIERHNAIVRAAIAEKTVQTTA